MEIIELTQEQVNQMTDQEYKQYCNGKQLVIVDKREEKNEF